MNSALNDPRVPTLVRGGRYGIVTIKDFGGTADKLVLPFASTDVYFSAFDNDTDGAADLLLMYTNSTDAVVIFGQLEPYVDQAGHIEAIRFTDGTLSIGSATPQSQTLSAAPADASSAERQVAELNEASTLDAAEKEKLSEAAKKVLEEAKNERL